MTQYLETKWHDNAAALVLLGYEFDFDVDPAWCRPGRSTRWRRRTAFLGKEWNSLAEDPAASPRIVHVTGSATMEDRLAALRRVAGIDGLAGQPLRLGVH
jgi:hypothetical protein